MPNTLGRPTLLVQTVYFAAEERKQAAILGRQLYARLTRPLDSALSFGAAIPVAVAVAPGNISKDAADHVIVVAPLGRASLQDENARRQAIEYLIEWHKDLGAGHVIPIPMVSSWRSPAGQLPGKVLLTELGAARAKREATLDEIVLAICRALGAVRPASDGRTIDLFISHAKPDTEATKDAARLVHDHIKTKTTGSAFFDHTDLLAGHSLLDQIDAAAGRGVFVAIRSDAYGSRSWCQRELLRAKQSGLPTLTVDVLRRGEPRSSPYAGNGPTMLWDGRPQRVVSQAMVEWLRARHFALDARRIVDCAGLPKDTVVLARPPELLDLAQGPLRASDPTLVLYPDPELSVAERTVLHRAQPRLRLLTPTTAYRQMLRRLDGPSMAGLLAGLQVAMSLSDSPDVDGDQGFTADHLKDATVYLARTLISAGAAIAYGGDFRLEGFDTMFAELIQAYNQLATAPADYLHSYLPAPFPPPGGDVNVTLHHLGSPSGVGTEALLPPSRAGNTLTASRLALYVSDMRRVMARHCFARVAIGGKTLPNTTVKNGYGGRYPGLVEEAWRTLEAGAPLYVVGGFGGAAALLADLLEGRPTPERLKDDTEFAVTPKFVKRAKAIDEDPARAQLGLPVGMGALADVVRQLVAEHLESDATSRAWNGLTLDENHTLWRTRDPLTIASLVLGGLIRVAERAAADKLRVDLVPGNVTSTTEADAIAIGAFCDVELSGAGAALNSVLSGRLAAARMVGQGLVSLPGDAVDADWLFVADLGRLGERPVLDAVRQAAIDTAHVALRYGFRRIAVVTFGANVGSDLEATVDAMIDGLSIGRSRVAVEWFEVREDRFARIRKRLEQRQDVLVATRATDRVSAAPAGVAARDEQIYTTIRRTADGLNVVILPPGGTAAVFETSSPMSDQRFGELARSDFGKTPSMNGLATRGQHLADEVFGQAGCDVLRRCGDAQMVVVHDVDSARLPFELLRVGDHRVAKDAGLVRRPFMKGLRPDRLFLRPPRVDALTILMVVNPTRNLDGAEVEATEIRRVLDGTPSVRFLEDLRHEQASKGAILAALAREDIDIFHYSGHAFFDGPGAVESGLICAGDERLTLADLSETAIRPRLAFVNACESARMRDVEVSAQALAFAELFLRSGIEAYLGTFWRVQDAAAADFAANVYATLADGMSLGEAVRGGRRGLFEKAQSDWANYVLYGDGSLHLRRPEGKPA